MTMQGSVSTDQATVLAAVQARLQSQISEFQTDNVCFIVANPEEFEPPQRQTLAVTIAPNSGEFDQRVFEGAGDEGVLENSGFTVTVWSRINLDRPDEATKAMTDASRGVFAFKKLILKALSNYMPTDNSGNSLLAEYIAPLSSGFPEPRSKGMATVSVGFSLCWLWDLT